MKTTIIIPTYNERENIAQIVPEIFKHAPEVRILVVDDNSPDKTYDVVREMQKKFPNLSLLLRQQKAGLGKAYIHAFETVLEDGKSDAILMMDADFSHNPEYVPAMLKLGAEAGVVIGCRYIKGGKIVDWPLSRRLLSRFANFYAGAILRLPIHDYTSGFIFMRTEYLRKVNLDNINSRGYAFLMELKSLLWLRGARIAELPIVLRDRTRGASKMSGGVIWEGVGAPWKIRTNYFGGSSAKKARQNK